MPRVLAVLVLCAFPLMTSAGVVYDFVTTIESSRTAETVHGRVWSEGEAYRAELQRGGKTFVAISRDGDETVTYLDLAGRKWSNRSRAAGGNVRSSSLFVWPVVGAKLTGLPQIAHRREAPVSFLGFAAVPHTIDVRFDVESTLDGASVNGTYHVLVRVTTIESLPALPMKSDLRTGYAAVDVRIRPVMEKLRGMVVQHELEVTRTLDGGPPQSERTMTKVTTLEQTEVAPSRFEVPESFE